MTHVTPRRVGAAFAIAALGSLLLLLVLKAPASRGESNPNNLDCQGHIKKGKTTPLDDPDEYQVEYRFACSGPITGYSISLQRGVKSFDTEAVVLNKTTGDGITTDSFTCQGEIPGLGFNCTGLYSGGYNVISGRFAVGRKLNRKPLINPRLVVSTAGLQTGTVTTGTTTTRTTSATQALSGPYQLGHPRGVNKKKTKKKTAERK